MDLNWTATILALAPPAAPAVTEPNKTAASLQFFLMMGVMVVMFYFVLIRPQQKKAKEHAALLKNVKRGDRIITSAGLVGMVETVKEKTIIIKSDGSKLEITKAAIASIESSGEATEA